MTMTPDQTAIAAGIVSSYMACKSDVERIGVRRVTTAVLVELRRQEAFTAYEESEFLGFLMRRGYGFTEGKS